MSDLRPNGKVIHVLLADTNELLRDGLRVALDQEPDFQVVGVARTVESALAAAARLKPELIVAELQFGGRTATDLLRGLRQAGCRTRVPALRTETSEAKTRMARAAGASAHLLYEHHLRGL